MTAEFLREWTFMPIEGWYFVFIVAAIIAVVIGYNVIKSRRMRK